MGNNNLKTNIIYFEKEKGKEAIIKNVEIITSFFFNNKDFYLIYKNGYYYICFSKNNKLISLWRKKEMSNGIKLLSGEIIGIFRKLYFKNKINDEKLQLFLEKPLEYTEKYKKD